jgi:hypothetical protein
MASHEQVAMGYQHVALAAGQEHAPKTGLLEAELPLYDAERVLTFWTDVSLGGFDQIIQAAFRDIGESKLPPRPHRDVEADGLALHPLSLLDPLIAGIGVDH